MSIPALDEMVLYINILCLNPILFGWEEILLSVLVDHNYEIFHRDLSLHYNHISNDVFCLRCLGEYENLWAAATGGRGTGRGRKKKINIAPNPENLFFGIVALYLISHLVKALVLMFIKVISSS